MVVIHTLGSKYLLSEYLLSHLSTVVVLSRTFDSARYVCLCAESMREWREYSRRARGPFNHVPEPSGKCDLRALRSRVMRSASGAGASSGPSGLESERDDSTVEHSVWRSLLP